MHLSILYFHFFKVYDKIIQADGIDFVGKRRGKERCKRHSQSHFGQRETHKEIIHPESEIENIISKEVVSLYVSKENAEYPKHGYVHLKKKHLEKG